MPNNSFSQTIIVSTEQTAEHLGSGTLAVLATPAMIACMENTAMRCLSGVTAESTSVGISINVNHLKASKVGTSIHYTAIITGIEGRKYIFCVQAVDMEGDTIGEGTHERVVVNAEKFMSKL
jgi:predicted thioesterase